MSEGKNFLDNLSGPLKQGLNDRFQDPYIGAFTISALIWNYQVWIYAFSDLSPDTRIALIHRSLNHWSYGAPILVSVGINLIIPFLFPWAYKLAARMKVKLKSIEEQEQLNLITHKTIINRLKEETEEYQLKISQKDEELGAMKQKYESLIFELRNSREEKIIENDNLKQQIQSLNEQLHPKDSIQRTIDHLKNIGQFENFLRLCREVVSNGYVIKSSVESDLYVNLDSLKLVQTGTVVRNGKRYSTVEFTTFGREVYESAYLQSSIG